MTNQNGNRSPLNLFAVLTVLLLGIAQPVASQSQPAALSVPTPIHDNTLCLTEPVIYFNDFEGAIGPEWSQARADATPVGGRKFLGQFGNETATLTLGDLPAHAALAISFDLFIIRTWDGSTASWYGATVGPDIWDVSIEGVSVPLLHTTFTNWDAYGFRQAYPAAYPAGDYPARTMAAENNTLGYIYPDLGIVMDSVYRPQLVFPHSASSLVLKFSGPGLQAVSDESWGLDNVTIKAISLSDPSLPGGQISSPVENSTTGPGRPIVFTADAWGDVSGSGIQLVEFYVFHNRAWLNTTIDTLAPYGALWSAPDNLRSQQLRFGIDVVDNAGTRVASAGSVRSVNFIESLEDPGVHENWIPARAYLNQRALPGGWAKSSAVSMSMALAMNGLIGYDDTSMANKANEMFPHVFKDGVIYVYRMRDELNRQGAVSQYYDRDGISAERGWTLLRQEINAGNSVIVRTAPRVMTPAGHFIVAVGYREKGITREVIAYDPFGLWRGMPCSALPGNCESNYDANTDTPESRKGQWGYYDFDLMFGGCLITVHRPGSPLVGFAGTPPDVMSDEPANILSYPGVSTEIGARLFFPTMVH